MSLDLFILITASVEFWFFWILHFILFRTIRPENVIKWLIYLYLLTNLVGSVFSLWFLNLFMVPIISHKLVSLVFIMAAIFSIFSLLVCIYIIGIFGIIESSIRIKLLSIITQASIKGLTKKDILKIYNSQTIISKRLLRLRSSQDLILFKAKYYPGKRLSPIFLMAQLTRFIAWLYK